MYFCSFICTCMHTNVRDTHTHTYGYMYCNQKSYVCITFKRAYDFKNSKYSQDYISIGTYIPNTTFLNI